MPLTFYPKVPKESHGTNDRKFGDKHNGVASAFLETLVRNLCNRAWAFHKIYPTADIVHPLVRKERMIYGLLAAAAASLTPVVITELPVKAKGSGTSGKSGRTDLFCLYPGKGNKKYEIYLELKAKSSRAKSFEKDRRLTEITKKWKEVQSQIDRLDHPKMRAQQEGRPIHVIRIGLLIVPWMAKATEDRTIFHDGIRSHLSSARKNTVWSWSWLTPKDLKGKNPAVGFFAVVRGENVGETQRARRKRREPK